jgi:hypothetical protein
LDIHKKKPKRSKSEDDKFPKPSETVVATAVKRNSFFFAAFGVGKWDKNTLRLMFNKFEDYVKQPDYKHKLEIFSDGNNDYKTVLPEYYNKDCLCYGQKVKSKNGEKIIPAIKRKVYGNPKQSDIDTNHNECFNSILRDKLRKLVRKTKCHPKGKYELNMSLFFFQFYWNFMHELYKNVTPAILEKQATKVWSWGNFLHAKLTFVN